MITISESAKDILKSTKTAEQGDLLRNVSIDPTINVTAFGINMGLTFLGYYLANKKGDSYLARSVARILGVNVDALQRDKIIDKISNKEYYRKLQDKVLNVTKTQSIEEFRKYLGDSYKVGEAWEIYRQIKDIVLDSNFIEMVTNVSTDVANLKLSLKDNLSRLQDLFEMQLSNMEKEFYKTYDKGITNLEILRANFEIFIGIKSYPEATLDCWEEARFRNEHFKENLDARRTIVDTIIRSIDTHLGTIIYGDEFYGKSMLLKRVMFELTDKGYAILYGQKASINQPYLLKSLFDKLLGYYSKLLVIVNDVHHEEQSAIFKIYNEFIGNKDSDVRFLFAARERELDLLRNRIPYDDSNEIGYALKNLQQIRLSFSEEDAILYMKKAWQVSLLKEMKHQGLSTKTFEIHATPISIIDIVLSFVRFRQQNHYEEPALQCSQ